tara:strand:- start:124 stop:462 length:339 start_codon:yes stop_codon:yes gene_type:complete
MHKTVSKDRFKTLGKLLAKNGIDIEYQIDWSESVSWTKKYTDQPRLGSFSKNGIPGWYFRKTTRDNFTKDEKKLIKEIFDKKGFKVDSIWDFEMEYDDDRSWNPSINFTLKQ